MGHWVDLFIERWHTRSCTSIAGVTPQPAQKWRVMLNLLERAHWIEDEEHIGEECKHLQQVDKMHVCMVVKRRRVKPVEEEEPIWKAVVVPFYQTATNRLARLLSCRNIRATSYPLPKLKQQLCQVKDLLGLKVPRVYRVPCECEASYVGQRGRLVSMRIIEHKRHLQLG